VRRYYSKVGTRYRRENSEVCYFTQTAARWFNNSGNVTPSPNKHCAVQAAWAAPQYGDVILRSPTWSPIEDVIAARGQSRDYHDNVPVSIDRSLARHCLAVETKVSATEALLSLTETADKAPIVSVK